MAQVTMDSKEYLELVDKARKLDSIEQAMVEGVQIKVDQESAYSKFHMEVMPTFTAEAHERIIGQVVDAIKGENWLVDYLYQDNKHFLNVARGSITYNWNEQAEQGEVDLLKNKEFKKVWDEARKRAESSEALDQEMLEEEE